MAAHEGKVAAVVLAAGNGRRMRSDLPKVLHNAAGRPLLFHVLGALEPVGRIDRRFVVTSARPDVEEAVKSAGWADSVTCVVQEPARGTGDAVRVALEAGAADAEYVLVTAGDAPLLQTATFEGMLDAHLSREVAATVLTADLEVPLGYGRIVRDTAGNVEAVVEESDASESQRSITEVNTSTYVFHGPRLTDALATIEPSNQQGEYYLTDVIESMRGRGHVVSAYKAPAREVMGVNSRAQLAEVGAVLHRRVCERWMNEGVTIVDPATTYIDASAVLEQDAVIEPFTFIHGSSLVRRTARLGPQVRLVDAEIGEGATVSFAVVTGARVGPEAQVGPFASLRPGTVLERGAKVGTFVETKQTTLGPRSKAPHLSYLGDAEIGSGVNIGAGTITCNWDGREKHKTVIEDDAYISSDTMLVAPTRIGRRAATGAGAVVRGDVPADALAVGAPARVLPGKGDRMGRRSSDDLDDAERSGESKSP
ncbi:MAG TPA: bifunctional UDP-N-acetylglucosamine diphosphorylase/glucosamine-1-phosphate N-acetyltransferase GlmU, partial [Actinomycetota bacterium]|nr:bifunctional UDP-N-acetylglucosamine diphosphorylase/glucosamine-1-phosphate N-acetyltransferase GlmU [Actinomycetota bacterium]